MNLHAAQFLGDFADRSVQQWRFFTRDSQT
jgi:hypothetical protein